MTMIQTEQHSLYHPILKGTRYDFFPSGETVAIIFHRLGKPGDRYEVPIEEARQLWVDLTKRGYERF